MEKQAVVNSENGKVMAGEMRRPWYRNSRFPIVPWFNYTPADKYNVSGWHFGWLMLSVWTSISPEFGLWLILNGDGLYVQVMLPYLDVRFYFLMFPRRFNRWLHEHLWRRAD